jgi:DNA polymerase III subunit delta'
MIDAAESDRLADTPHPRETSVFVGHAEAERTLIESYASGRMPHGWIIGGPEGVGKATLAYRMARFALANPAPEDVWGRADLAVPPDHPVARQVASQSHVDLMVLKRVLNHERKTFFSEIRAEDVRRVVSFFGSTAGSGGWRIAIVDVADDLNAAGANALLKILEEPPPRCLFLILAHQPGRMLPTIRSRCRRLILGSLSTEDAAAAARLARPDLDGPLLASAAKLGRGSVRRTITLASGEGLDLHETLAGILDGLPRLDKAAAHSLAERCMGKGGDDAFALILSFLEDWLHDRVLAERDAAPARLARWAEVWEKAAGSARDVEVFNLDRRPFVLSTLSMLARASQG